MKYIDFIKILRKFPILRPQDLHFLGRPEVLRAELSRWRKQGKLIELKKGFFVLPEEIAPLPDPFFLANQMLFPSYVSLKTALGFYGMLKSREKEITSVTTRKTRIYNTNLWKFTYSRVKEKLFFGMVQRKMNGIKFFIATPEKALLDTMYIEGERFSLSAIKRKEILHRDILLKMASSFPTSVRKRAEEFFER